MTYIDKDVVIENGNVYTGENGAPQIYPINVVPSLWLFHKKDAWNDWVDFSDWFFGQLGTSDTKQVDQCSYWSVLSTKTNLLTSGTQTFKTFDMISNIEKITQGQIPYWIALSFNRTVFPIDSSPFSNQIVDGTTIYAIVESGRLIKIDMTTQTAVANISIGYSNCRAMAQDATYIYITSTTPSNRLIRVAKSTFTVTSSIALSQVPYDVTVANWFLYVSCATATVYKVNATTFTLTTTLTTGLSGVQEAITYMGWNLYTANGTTMYTISEATFAVTGSAAVGISTSCNLTNDGTYIYGLYGYNSIRKINSSLGIVSTLSVTNSQYGYVRIYDNKIYLGQSQYYAYVDLSAFTTEVRVKVGVSYGATTVAKVGNFISVGWNASGEPLTISFIGATTGTIKINGTTVHTFSKTIEDLTTTNDATLRYGVFLYDLPETILAVPSRNIVLECTIVAGMAGEYWIGAQGNSYADNITIATYARPTSTTNVWAIPTRFNLKLA
jgi:hypothetical protein